MSDVVIPYRFLCRGGTAAALAALNEVPKKRELIVETDTGLMKLGDGVTHYNSLLYLNGKAAIAAAIHAATSKTTPVDADELALIDSAASNVLKKLTWANLKAGIFSAWGALVSAGTSKGTPVDADSLAICDSEAGNATKKLTLANIKAYVNTGSTSGGTPPLSANFTPFGTGLTVTDKSDRMQLIVTTGTVLRGITQASIAPPYTIRARIQPCGLPFASDSFWAGIALSNGTAYRTLYLGSTNTSTNVPAMRVAIDAWTNSTTFSAAVSNMGLPMNPSDFWVGITDDGTTRKYSVSGNGKDWVQVFSEATNTGLTPTAFGIVVYNHANTPSSKVAIPDWQPTASVLGDAA